MRTLYLTTMIFCHILLSSFILYSTITSASPVGEQPISKSSVSVDAAEQTKDALVKAQPAIQYAPAVSPKVESKVEPQLYSSSETFTHKSETPIASMTDKDSLVQKSSVKSAETPKSSSESVENKQPPKYLSVDSQQQIIAQPTVNKQEESPVVSVKQEQSALPVQQQSAVAPLEQNRPELKAVLAESAVPVEPVQQIQSVQPVQPKLYESDKPVVQQQLIPLLSDSVQEKLVAAEPVVAEIKQQSAPELVVKPAVNPPAVKGGLGPLHLLAATLCSYQPHKPVSDETLTYLYNQRASQRKNLFQFMSLKFTNLDKLTAHLNVGGAEVAKTVDSSESSLVRSHGWPVVGNCTAHYLKLMAEAAWCDCVDEPHCLRDAQETKQPRQFRRSVSNPDESAPQVAPAMDKGSSVMSKLMYVGDAKEAPLVESSQPKTPVQPASVAFTRQCRRNALKMAKALFNHLAESQTEVSSSWPKLQAELSQDECARKRMIDIVNALSTFRSESTQVHRDNIEFAFAMDDLRGKVLENEVNTPLTFDKQVIEVEQFLQQSVRLMLANIDPKRAKLTSMRYRSLHAPVSADDQCIELHQRLLAKNYPDECNPNQYGPLPDVLKMAALSLDLWSIEQDLSKYSPVSQVAPKQQDVNECIANLVAN